MYTSLIFSIIIGLKTEYHYYKKKHPEYKLRKADRTNIPIHEYRPNMDNGKKYYSPGDKVPKYWDNLSNNFWKKHIKGNMNTSIINTDH